MLVEKLLDSRGSGINCLPRLLLTRAPIGAASLPFLAGCFAILFLFLFLGPMLFIRI